MYVKNMIDQTL